MGAPWNTLAPHSFVAHRRRRVLAPSIEKYYRKRRKVKFRKRSFPEILDQRLNLDVAQDL